MATPITPDFLTGYMLIDTSTSAGTVSLPLSTSVNGRTLTLKDAKQTFDIHHLTITLTSPDAFEDGSISMVISTKGASIDLTAYGGIWYIKPVVFKNDLFSTIGGLGSAGYISSLINVTLISSIQGVFSTINTVSVSSLQGDFSSINTSALYINGVEFKVIDANITAENVTSSIQGLGTSGYISSISTFDGTFASTVQGLGSSGYISSISTFNETFVSTVQGLGSSGYVSSFDLFSTIEGLGSSGYISSFDLFSTIEGLGSSGYISSFDLFSTIEGLGSSGYVSSFDLTSTIEGLGSLGYISTTGSVNNGLFTLVYLSEAVGKVSFNSATNSIYASDNYSACNVTSLESYNNVFFSCVANINDITANTKFGLIDSSDNLVNYFYNNTGNLSYYVNGNYASVHPWNSNDVLAISLTNQGASQTVSFFVNGSNIITTKTNDSNSSYRAVFSYFTIGDKYSNIVFSGSYGILSSNASVFLTAYPSTESPIFSTIQLIDTSDSSSVLQLSNYQSNLYFNGNQLADTESLISSITGLGSSGYISSLINVTSISSFQGDFSSINTSRLFINGVELITGDVDLTIGDLTSSIEGLGSSGYVSSFTLTSTIEGLGSSGYISSISTFNETFASTVQGLGSSGYVSSFYTNISAITVYASTIFASTVVASFVLQVQSWKFT